MSTPIPLSRTPRALLVAVVWTFLILGLLVMHGAGSHGATAHVSAASADVLESSASHDGPTDPEVLPGSEDRTHQDSGSHGEPSGHSAAELCLAILVALTSVIAAFVALSRPRRLLFTVRRATNTDRVPPWLRPPDPPCLIRLSILRC